VAEASVSGAREEILGRVRTALRDVPAGERPFDVEVARHYRRRDQRARAELVDLLAERLSDYHAQVRRVAVDEVAGTVSEVCHQLGLKRVAVPAELPGQWRPADVEVVEDQGLEAHTLDQINAAVTGCALAIAETGTLVLDGRGASGRRIITLVPDHHVCVVGSDQVVGQVPEAITAVAEAVSAEQAPITLVSGPSASSDIELTRVEGVHGPRHLVVVIAS
jgi:L-lactate dehydrogenase complex protein LldG